MARKLAVLSDPDAAEMIHAHADAVGDYCDRLYVMHGFRDCLDVVLKEDVDTLILQLQVQSDVAGCLDLMHALDGVKHMPVILLFEKRGNGSVVFAATDPTLELMAKGLTDFFRVSLSGSYHVEYFFFRPAALEHELLENSVLGKEAALMEILRGCSPGEIGVYKKLYSLDLRSNGYYLFFWELQRTEYHNHYINKDVYNLMGQILERKYLSVLSEYEGGEEFRINLDRRCIIINDLTTISEAAKYAKLEELLQRLVACGSCKTASHYISERIDKLDNIRFARDRYENEKSNIFFLRYDGIMRADKVRRLKNAKEVTIESVLPNLQRISGYIRYDILNPLLLDELHALYFDIIKPSMSYTLYYYCLAAICSDLVKEDGATNIGMLTENLTPELMRFSSIEEQYDIMVNYIAAVRGRVGNRRKSSNVIVKNAVEYINEHYAEDLSIPGIAEAMYVSHMYLSKVFRSIMGTSVINYLIALRIDKAKLQLEETDLPVYEIAQAVGFNDIKHFSKTFKNIVGASPTEYRRRLRGSRLSPPADSKGR